MCNLITSMSRNGVGKTRLSSANILGDSYKLFRVDAAKKDGRDAKKHIEGLQTNPGSHFGGWNEVDLITESAIGDRGDPDDVEDCLLHVPIAHNLMWKLISRGGLELKYHTFLSYHFADICKNNFLDKSLGDGQNLTRFRRWFMFTMAETIRKNER